MEKFLDVIAFIVLCVLPISIVVGVWLSLAKNVITVFGAM
jgi:hypothetical protein